jgi:alpha-mannosidase
MTHSTRWTLEKITQRLALIEPLVHRRSAALAPFRFCQLPGPAAAPPVAPDVDDSDWTAVEPGAWWAGPDVNFILRGAFEVPADWPDGPLALHLRLGTRTDFSLPEALVYIDSEPYATVDNHHAEFRLPRAVRDGRRHALALHGWSGLDARVAYSDMPQLRMGQSALVQIDEATADFVATARVALNAAKALDTHAPARGNLLNALDDAFKLLDTREPFGEGFYASVPEALRALKDGIARAGDPLEVRLTATGHAHIDTAWLWTLDQTRRKVGRTWHTALRLMERFPDYHFTQSQPQLYAFAREDYPALFEAIKERVAEGRWEPIGGMWVEADCNISGPESLARQFLLGRTFFREHLGRDAESPVLWLPDVFGYSWALPQLIKQAGLDYFFTIKIGWNQYNRLPYDSFWWQGIDGTRVLTHFSTTTDEDGQIMSTYNAQARPEDALRTWTHFQQKEQQSEVFMSFGYGDGGGGPTAEMAENLDRLKAFPGMPQVRQRGAGAFFRDLERESGGQLPTWNGELYLELHRGTYTTQGRSKRANRKSEFLLHDAEFLAAYAATVDPAYRYPSEAFTEAWRLVCLNQFHDIIPGSSIGAVYEESLAQYAEVRRIAEAARDEALAALAKRAGGDVLLVNPTGFARSDMAWWPEQITRSERLVRTDGTSVRTSASDRGTWISAGELPPYSLTALRRVYFEDAPAPAPLDELTVTPILLENGLLRVELNAAGDVTRIFDKRAGREVLSPGAVANQFQAFEDRPMMWDAWDIDVYYDDWMWLAEPADAVRVVEAGPLRATLEIERRILNSRYTQRITLTAGSSRLDVETVIDWREKHILLKVAFPVEILSPTATYEIQYGAVERPTHRNTSWDWARFETVAQKWVDLSEGGYGVSLLNDCKYGHDIRDNVMRLTLLRSPTSPDPGADQGEHRFAYSLLPHAGGWQEVTQREAYALNDPIIALAGAGGAARQLPSLVRCDSPNVVIETVKRAEDGNGLLVRLYEGQRKRGPARLVMGFPVREARLTNLLEEDEDTLRVEGNTVELALRPFQIATVRVVAA